MKQLVRALARSFRAALFEVEAVLGGTPAAPHTAPRASGRLAVGTVVYPSWDYDTGTPPFGLVCPDLEGVDDPRWVTVQWSGIDHLTMHLVGDVIVATEHEAGLISA